METWHLLLAILSFISLLCDMRLDCSRSTFQILLEIEGSGLGSDPDGDRLQVTVSCFRFFLMIINFSF